MRVNDFCILTNTAIYLPTYLQRTVWMNSFASNVMLWNLFRDVLGKEAPVMTIASWIPMPPPLLLDLRPP